MEPMLTLNVRFSREQVEWLDARRQGPIVTRSEVLRHLVADAMACDRRRSRAAQRRVAEACSVGR